MRWPGGLDIGNGLGGLRQRDTLTAGLMEFFLNVFIEFAEFNDKNICHYSKSSNLPSLVLETSMLPQHQQGTCGR